MTPLPTKKLRIPKRRKISEYHLNQMVAAFKKEGQLKPILIDTRLGVVDGAARLLAARELGWKTILTRKLTEGPAIARRTNQRGSRRAPTTAGHIS
jgi:ParB-like chromosome segregation protein Spo0J